MDVVTYRLAEAFLERASPFLLGAESEHNLPCGVALYQRGVAPHDGRFFATLEQGGEVIGVAVWTSPFRLLLSRLPADVVTEIAEHVASLGLALPGVHATDETAEAFAAAFTRATGKTAKLDHRERQYEVTRVVPPAGVSGALREAVAEDVDLVASWVQGFNTDVGFPRVSDEAVRRSVAQRIERHEVFVWVDGGPRSMAALTRPTPNGVAINYVFTPEEERGKSYAKACVAALSSRELGRGKRAVCLNADLANPISNQVYLSIGFTPVADVRAIELI